MAFNLKRKSGDLKIYIFSMSVTTDIEIVKMTIIRSFSPSLLARSAHGMEISNDPQLSSTARMGCVAALTCYGRQNEKQHILRHIRAAQIVEQCHT